MRIVIAEDSAVVRAGLAEILADSDHEVVAAVGNADDLLAAVAEHRPDVAVVDVRMPPGYTDEGLRAAIAIRRDHPQTGVLVFSQYIRDPLYGRSARRGVRWRCRGCRVPAQGPGRRRRGVRRSS
jgi:DNA-binding NarL/FixJ family response regulator